MNVGSRVSFASVEDMRDVVNAPDHRPRASDARLSTETRSRGGAAGLLAIVFLSDINRKARLVDYRYTGRCPLADHFLRDSLKNLDPTLYGPGVPQAELGRFVNSDNHNRIAAAILPAKWNLTRTLVVKEVTISS